MVSRSLTIRVWTSSRDLMAVMVVGDKRSTAADSRVGTPPAARAATRSTMAGGSLPPRGGGGGGGPGEERSGGGGSRGGAAAGGEGRPRITYGGGILARAGGLSVRAP